MAIKLTPSRRSQILEMLLRQNAQPQTPQTVIEAALRLGANYIRQQQANKLQEAEASRESQIGANTANLASLMMGGEPTDFQGRPIQGADQKATMAQAIAQTLKQDPQNPLGLAVLQSQLNKKQEQTKLKVERVPFELKEDIDGVGKRGETVMGVFRANPVTGEAEYAVGSRKIDGSKIRTTEQRTATREAGLTKPQAGKELLDLGKKNQTAYKIEELLNYDPKDFLTVGSKYNIFKGTLKDKLDLPFWQVDPEEQRYLAEAQRFNGMTSQLFQAIRTEVTGAQAAMVELKYLEAAYLSGKMGPTQYKSALSLLQDMNDMAMEIKADLISEGFGAVDPQTGRMDTEALQTEFGRRFDQRWDSGKAYEIIPQENMTEAGGKPENIPQAVWDEMSEEDRALFQ